MTEIVYGQHSVKTALEQGRLPQALYSNAGKAPKINEYLKSIDCQLRLQIVDAEALDHLADGGNHQGWVAVYDEAAKTYSEDDLPELLAAAKTPFILILDGVQDPHNLGACLRTADAAGITAVIAAKDNAVGLTPTVRKVASGAAETVPFITVANLARCLQNLKEAGVWLYGLSAEASTSLYANDLRGPLGLVLGAEGQGLRRLTRERCDHLVSLPMLGQVSSLNVSVATGVCLYEVLRQRGLGV